MVRNDFLGTIMSLTGKFTCIYLDPNDVCIPHFGSYALKWLY